MNIKRFDKNHSVIARNAKPELSGFTQSSPGMLIQFVIFWLLFPAGSLVRERRQHNLDRLRAAQITYSSILVGLVARKEEEVIISTIITMMLISAFYSLARPL